MKALNIPLEEFLKPFFDAGETVCLRVFADRKGTAFRGQKLECEAAKIGSMVDTFKKHNAQNRGIFFVVNYGGHAFKYSDDGSTIRLDTKKSKAAFIKLLNDAFLRSELTKEYYEARAKDNITNS